MASMPHRPGRGRILYLIAAFVVLALHVPSALAESPHYPILEKWTGPRVYHAPFWPKFADRIVVGPGVVEPDSIRHDRRVYSPNKAFWYVITSPDFTKPGPWSTQFHIYNDRDRLFQLALRDHGNSAGQAKWINEKLLYVQVWWGRIVGSYVILDVEKETILAQEMVHYGGLLFQQYQRSKPYLK
jgi:hypothetical protein